jgi:RimJ/RimL family protein N-acetyltransferase
LANCEHLYNERALAAVWDYLLRRLRTDVGWVLRADTWGRGLATEAGRARTRWAFEHLDVPYVTACIASAIGCSARQRR